MISAPIPDNEDDRLAALRSYQVLDTDPELAFDDITALAAQICQTPIALVSLIDAERQWFKSHHGLPATETPRDYAFCAHAMLGNEPMVIKDSSRDPRFHDNPLVTGEPHVQFYAGAPLIDVHGHRLGTLCVIDHQAREISSEQIDALERLSHQVVAQLELRRTRDEARAAAKAKSDFLANMSHEIRTPLNGVLGMTQLLADTEMSDEQREMIEVVQRSGTHLMCVVNDILDFTRLEAGRMTLAQHPFNLHQLIMDLISVNQPYAKHKNIALQLEWRSQHSAQRLGDAQRLRQLLFNLIGNAIKFTNQGSVTIEVQDLNNEGVRINVIDTGIGIRDDLMPTLFDKFVQGDNSTTRRFGGTGLGLAIAAQLVRLMQGRIGAHSELGKGSCFWFELPLKVAATPNPLHAKPRIHCDLQQRKVLIAEDDPVNQLLICRMLEQFNANITITDNGLEAVRLCRQQAFDLILMDGLMPGLDGYDATTQIRALPDTWAQRVPIIALTANAMEGDRERCLLVGMSDYLSKPFDRHGLIAVLNRALRQIQAQTSNASDTDMAAQQTA